jgi:hypothetical protein
MYTLANLSTGMSLETFWGGKEGAAEFEAWMAELNGGLDPVPRRVKRPLKLLAQRRLAS